MFQSHREYQALTYTSKTATKVKKAITATTSHSSMLSSPMVLKGIVRLLLTSILVRHVLTILATGEVDDWRRKVRYADDMTLVNYDDVGVFHPSHNASPRTSLCDLCDIHVIYLASSSVSDGLSLPHRPISFKLSPNLSA